MKAFATMSKGKEVEREFSTLELAEADLFTYDYYLGSVVEIEVTQEELNQMCMDELGHEDAAHEYGQLTDLEKYRIFKKGMAA